MLVLIFRKGAGVDCVMDAARLGLREGAVGIVIMLSTIEHVWGTFDAFQNIFRSLSGNGVVIVTSHMDKTIHAYPSDYWRFTPEAFSRLLEPFSTKIVGYQGSSKHPANLFGIGFKNSLVDFKDRSKEFRLELEQSMSAFATAMPVRMKAQRLRRLLLWKLFGPKAAYHKLRDEFVIGRYSFPD